MTQMYPEIRQELTQLMADHLNESFGAWDIRYSRDWQEIAEKAMDFIYGSNDETQEPEADTDAGNQGNSAGTDGCCGTGCRAPAGVAGDLEFDSRRLMELTQAQIESLYGHDGQHLLGVMLIPQELVFPRCACGPDPTHPSEVYDLLRASGPEGTSPSPQAPDSTV